MIHSYSEYVTRKRREYGDKFSEAALSQQFVKYYESGQRIEVAFRGTDGIVYETKRGRIGVTTGWRPCFLLMQTTRSIGSYLTLSDKDIIVRVINPREPKAQGKVEKIGTHCECGASYDYVRGGYRCAFK